MNKLLARYAGPRDVEVLAAIEEGLPLCERPFARVAQALGMSEDEVISRLARMKACGIMRRFGLVLQHRPLGYCANAMLVFDIPQDRVDRAARAIVAHEFVTLCYCREPHLPDWPYNLYCMIHGRDRQIVEGQIIELKERAQLLGFASKTLFSLRRFKQTGARFSSATRVAMVKP